MAGSWHPATGDQRKVEPAPPMPWGLNTCTGPDRARTPLVRAKTSALVVVAITGPG